MSITYTEVYKRTDTELLIYVSNENLEKTFHHGSSMSDVDFRLSMFLIMASFRRLIAENSFHNYMTKRW